MSGAFFKSGKLIQGYSSYAVTAPIGLNANEYWVQFTGSNATAQDATFATLVNVPFGAEYVFKNDADCIVNVKSLGGATIFSFHPGEEVTIRNTSQSANPTWAVFYTPKEMRAFNILSITSNVAQLSYGSIFLADGRELYSANEISFNLKTAVHTDGVTSPAATTRYYLYIDLARLPASSNVGSADRKVFVPASGTTGAFIVFTSAPDEIIDLSRYVPIAALKTDGSSNYTAFENISAKRDPGTNVVVNPLAYSDTDRSVGSVGSSGQLGTQGPLLSSDFTDVTKVHWYPLVGNANDASPNTAINLVATGTPVYLSNGFYGRATVVNFDGASTLGSTDAFFNPGNGRSWAVGGWFACADWIKTAATGVYASGRASSVDRAYSIFGDANGGIVFAATNTTSTWDALVTIPAQGFAPNSWHHLMMVYDFSTTTLKAYIDGVLVGRATLANTRAMTSSIFRVAGEFTSPSNFAVGMRVQDLIFVNNQVVSDADVLKYYSKRYSATQQIALGHALDADSFSFANSNLSWYNLTSVNDGSANARNLTNNNSIPFTGLGLFGVAAIATLNGTNQSFSSTDAFFNPGGLDFACGGWFRANNWNTGSIQVLFGNYAASGDRGWIVYIQTDGSLRLTAAESASVENPIIIAGNILTQGWYHVAMRYTSATLTYELFVNGVSVGKAINVIANRTITSSIFRIGAFQTSASGFWGGSVSDFFFMKGLMTDSDLEKIVSSKISLPAIASAVPPKNALWFANFKREDGKIVNQLPETAWLVDKSIPGKLYVNFGLEAGSLVDLYMQESGAVVRSTPKANYEAIFTSAPGATVAHGLPRMPAGVALLHNELADGKYVELDAASFVKVDGTNLYFNTTALALLTIDATHQLVVVASVGAVPSAQRQVTTIPVSSDITLAAGLKYMVDCSALRTLTLPANPGFGDEVLVQDATSQSLTNNLTVARNGQNIQGSASDHIIDVNGATVIYRYFNASVGWTVQSF